MTIVVGTAGHIDHGKTALLLALTGIDADRLPEERRRGMTIDVGYAHLGLPDGTELDFVDVPGHDRLVGNMLVGAGEIDAAMLIVAADDGPRAQTLEHLELIDALALRQAVAVVTKVDLVDDARLRDVETEVGRLLAGSSLAGSPVVAVSSETGAGLDRLLAALVDLRDRVVASSRQGSPHPRLAIDRVFRVKGRGTVVTGTLRGGALRQNATLRLVPGDLAVRARELQVHGRAVDVAAPGRTAINVAGIEGDALRRGMVLTEDPAVVSSDRLLVRLEHAVPDRTRVRAHLGTDSVDASIGRAGRDAIELPGENVAAMLRLSTPIAVAVGDRFVLRSPSRDRGAVGGAVLDPEPPRSVSRHRQTEARVRRLAAAVDGGDAAEIEAARLDLHGALRRPGDHPRLADDVAAAGVAVLLEVVATGGSAADAASPLALVRARAARTLRRAATLRPEEGEAAAALLLDRLVAAGRLSRRGERLFIPGREAQASGPTPETAAAMDRLERALSMPAPPGLGEAARAAGCPQAGIQELERSGRIIVIDDDLAYAASTYRDLEQLALQLAADGPLTPAALRDATGTSRKYVMALLTDLDRRGVLRRTSDGHLPGPRRPSMSSPAGAMPDRT